MKSSAAKTALIAVAFVALFGASMVLQNRELARIEMNPPFLDKWSLSGRSAGLLKVMALRYDMVAADFLWLRAIQSFGGRGMTNRDWRPVYDMFDTITELDPFFEEAYTFGNMVIGDEGGKQREALKLIDKGLYNLPRRYRIPFEGMYVANWSLGDKKLARYYGRQAMKAANAPDWVPRITAYLDVEAGQYYVGLDQFISNMLQGFDAGEPTIVGVALGRVRDSIDKWNRSRLTLAYDQFTSSTGRLPASIDDLAPMPALQDYETASITRLLAKLQVLLTRLGKTPLSKDELRDCTQPTPADVAAADRDTTGAVTDQKMRSYQNELFRYTIIRRSGIPDNPSGSRYVLNPTYVGFPMAAPGEAITTKADLDDFLRSLITAVRGVIAERKTELGRNPASLHEVFMSDFVTTEPLGGHWNYDPATGNFSSSSLPSF